MEFDHNLFIEGPPFSVTLPTIDACHPLHYSRRLLIFKCSSPAQRDVQLKSLKAGLQKLVVRCPVLGGILAPLSPEETCKGKEDYRTILPDKGLELVVKDLSKQIPSFEQLELEDFEPSKLLPDILIPVPLDLSNDRPYAACKVQYSAITGGTIITWSMSHCIGDGTANNELFRVLSEEMKSAERSSDDNRASVTTNMGLDRSVLCNVTSDLPFDIKDHPGYMVYPKTPPEAGESDESVSLFHAQLSKILVLLKLSPEALSQLKADATSSNGPPISTHDAIAALLWRSILLIRSRSAKTSPEAVEATIGDLFFPSDGRKHLNIPTSYIGNVVYQMKIALPLATLLSPIGLPAAAGAIRVAINVINPELVKSHNTKMKEGWIDWSFPSTFLTTGVAMGTDWTSGELYGLDWGKAFGKLVKYRYPGEVFTYILPKLEDGGAEILVGILPEEVELLKGDECFGKYLM
jgi:hypothetical protein